MLTEAYLKWLRLVTEFHLTYCWQSKNYGLL